MIPHSRAIASMTRATLRYVIVVQETWNPDLRLADTVNQTFLE